MEQALEPVGAVVAAGVAATAEECNGLWARWASAMGRRHKVVVVDERPHGVAASEGAEDEPWDEVVGEGMADSKVVVAGRGWVGRASHEQPPESAKVESRMAVTDMMGADYVVACAGAVGGAASFACAVGAGAACAVGIH